jgi:hypothetical protein
MDINGGQLTQTNGNPIWAAAQSTGPLTAGNIPHGDGVSALANVGEQIGGTGNVGYCIMGQFSAPIGQAAASAAGGVTTQIVLPAQSMVLQFIALITTAATGTTTYTITDTAGNSYVTGAAWGALGSISVTPTASKAVIQLVQNVGNQDVQLVVTAGGTGPGQMVLFCRYMQGCNSAQST